MIHGVESLADLIDRAVSERFKTQVALESACGVSDTAISNWRAGTTLPSRHVLPALAAALGMDATVLGELVAADRRRRRHGAATASPVIEA